MVMVVVVSVVSRRDHGTFVVAGGGGMTIRCRWRCRKIPRSTTIAASKAPLVLLLMMMVCIRMSRIPRSRVASIRHGMVRVAAIVGNRRAVVVVVMVVVVVIIVIQSNGRRSGSRVWQRH